MAISALPGVAPDVASRARFPGNANPDVRHFLTLEVAELPWPLIFGFVQVVEDDGTERLACTSFEAGRPVMRDEEGIDVGPFELTADRFRHIDDNFDRYRMIAERRLIATDENIERSRQIRRAMKRKRGEKWTTESLALLVNDWRALHGAPRGRIWALTERWGIGRTAIYRALEKAEAEGLLKPGERRHLVERESGCHDLSSASE